MSSSNRSTALIFAILVAAVLISASLIYAARKVSRTQPAADAELVKRISDQVLAKLEKDGALTAATTKAIKQLEQQRIADMQRQREQREQQRLEQAKKVRRVTLPRDHVRGNPKAPISLIEYSDFECPFCKRFHDTSHRLVAQYGDKLNWVYRHFPLPSHNPSAQKQAEASECAAELGGNDAFWKYTDLLFQRTRAGGRGFPLAGLSALAREIGLDGAAFQTCVDSNRYEKRVQEDLEEGSSVGITGTPGSILINNLTGEVRPVTGAQPITVFEKAIQELLPTAPAAGAQPAKGPS